MPALASDCLCLRTWDWSETSQTAALFSRDLGLLRVIAKGSKRPRSTFSGGLEPLTIAAAQFTIKPSTDLALLTRWDLIEIFPSIRQSLPAHYAALYLADLLAHFTAAHDPHPQLYDALSDALRQLPSGTTAALARGQWAILVETGYKPELNHLVHDGSPLPRATAYLFDPHQGGLVGPAELSAARGADGVDWRLRASTIEALRSLDAPQAASTPPDPDSLHRCARFLAVYLRHLLGQPVASLACVFPDLATDTPPPPTGSRSIPRRAD